MGYYTQQILTQNVDSYNRNATLQVLTGDKIEDKFSNYSNLITSIKDEATQVVFESESAKDIIDGLEDNHTRNYSLLLVVDSEDINIIIVCNEIESTQVCMQFNFCITNIFALNDKSEFIKDVDQVLVPFEFDVDTDDVVSAIKAYGLMILIKHNPDCWCSFTELMQSKVKFDFFEY
jgi:hypothetical protein